VQRALVTPRTTGAENNTSILHARSVNCVRAESVVGKSERRKTPCGLKQPSDVQGAVERGGGLRNRNTIEFLGIWEQLNNPDFNPVRGDRLQSIPRGYDNRTTLRRPSDRPL
jgi:hypothetical protein